LIALTPPGYVPLEYLEDVETDTRQPSQRKLRRKGAR
jgi:hypothetical protein